MNIYAVKHAFDFLLKDCITGYQITCDNNDNFTIDFQNEIYAQILVAELRSNGHHVSCGQHGAIRCRVI